MTVKVYYPISEQGRRELAKRVAGIHADTAMQYIDSLSCSAEQKTALIDAVISESINNSRHP